jgi:putative ABC transport system permease protein
MPSKRLRLLHDLGGDVRFSWRLLRRHPIYTSACVLTLALGIGATTSVYAVIDATLLLPYRSPDRLVAVGAWSKDPNGVETAYAASQIELLRWRAATRAFESIDAVEPRMLALTGNGDPEVVKAAAVTSGLFAMLGVAPQIGRTFTEDEERTDAARVVISDRLWRRRRPGVDAPGIGGVITLDGRPYDVVGVMPPGFKPLLIESDVWLPLHPTVDPAKLNLRIMAAAGRLRAGVTAVQAERELVPASAGLAREFPSSHGRMRPHVAPLGKQLYGSQAPGVVALAGAVLVLLILASVNVMNLTLGHLAERREEIAVRAMLGGSRWRLVRLQTIENGLIALAGCGLGLVIMNEWLPAILATYRSARQTPIDATLDWRVAAFAACVTCGTALACGIYPAIRAERAAAGGSRAAAGRATGGRWERRLRTGLVIAQVALAVTLCGGAGAFALSLARILDVSPGFSADRVLTAQLMLSPVRYRDAAARAQLVERIIDRLSHVSGVAAVGTTQTTFLPNQSMQTLMFVDGLPADADHVQTANIRHVTPGYFSALRVPMVEGRALADRDRPGSPPVCVVSASFAKQYWPRASALGHQVRRNGPTASWMTVVGVVGDVMDAGLGVAAGPTLYVPYLQQNTPTARVTLVARTTGDPAAIVRRAEDAIWAEDPLQPVDAIGRLADVLVESAGDRRFQTLVLAAFAFVGLTLALVGVYGVSAAAIRARTREIGIRIALGASPRAAVRTMMSESVRHALIGVAVGVAIFLAVGRAASRLLYATSIDDPRVLVGAAVPLAAAAILISYVQARRLASLSPRLALNATRDSMSCRP